MSNVFANEVSKQKSMLPESLEKLQNQFEKLPGVGPRQARRYAFFVFKQEQKYVEELIENLQTLRKSVTMCGNCYMPTENKEVCKVCADTKRDGGTICVVEKESDALTMEKSGKYKGVYFVLGENISPKGKNTLAKERIKNLINKIQNSDKNREIILALNNTREGNFTSLYIEDLFKKRGLNKKARLTRLGRGLSTGSELEYSDEETLKNALENRL